MLTIILSLLLSGILLYLLLYFTIPKATNLHEVLRLPPFWFHTLTAPTDNIVEEKIRYGKKWSQYFLYLTPKKNKVTRQHIILHFHGGGWVAGGAGMFRSMAQVLLDEGYIVILVNYRKVPWTNFDGLRNDLTMCLQKTIQVKEEKNISDKKIIISGMSAGSNLGALLMYDKEELAKVKNYNLPTKQVGNQITGAFLCGAPVDISQMKWSIPLFLFAGKRKGPTFKKANPINHVQGDESYSILLPQGTKDGMVPYRNVIPFYEKLKSFNPEKVELYILENGSHLDVAKWGYFDNDLRKKILDWLEKVDGTI